MGKITLVGELSVFWSARILSGRQHQRVQIMVSGEAIGAKIERSAIGCRSIVGGCPILNRQAAFCG